MAHLPFVGVSGTPKVESNHVVLFSEYLILSNGAVAHEGTPTSGILGVFLIGFFSHPRSSTYFPTNDNFPHRPTLPVIRDPKYWHRNEYVAALQPSYVNQLIFPICPCRRPFD